MLTLIKTPITIIFNMNRVLYCSVIIFFSMMQVSCCSCNNCYADSHVPDTTLNAQISLWNHTDISKTHLKNIVGDTNFIYEESMTYEDTIRDNNASRILSGGDLYPYVLLYNKDKTEFAIASPRYGTCQQCWRCFYIGLLSKETVKKEKHRVIYTEVPHFFTESGMHLLMSIDEVIASRGTPNIVQDSLLTYYYLSSDIPEDSEDYIYYTERNMGDMFITIVISAGRVIGIAYGYVEV